MTDQTTPTPAELSEASAQVLQPSMPIPAEVGSTESPRRRRRYLIIGAAAAFVLLSAGIALAGANQQSPLEAARETCGAASDDYAKLGDDGTTLTLRGVGKETTGLTFDQLECYWSKLDMPDSVRAEVGATRALDGRQSGQWEDIRASWSYHPDSGVQMVLTLAN